MINPLSSGIGQNLIRGPAGDITGTGSAAPQGTDATGGFGSMMTSIIKDTVTNLQVGEASAIAGMQNKMPLQKVVEAVMHAEESLRTAVVVRDKVVGAYLEISRMQI
jgi:flagellar hook-basal body complex protein FliE